MLKVGICGGSGYTGSELMRILSGHPEVIITAVTSERFIGRKVSDVFPHLHQYDHLIYEPLDIPTLLEKADFFFTALPHGASQKAVNYFFVNKKKIVDLSADFRLSDPAIYEQWYKTTHNFKETLINAVYGLPEINRDRIQQARLIANPGCYPTSVILGLYPSIKENLIDLDSIIIDSKSGTSGAGRKESVDLSYCEVNEGFKPYGIGVHRHIPEIEQELSLVAGRKIIVNFTPHLVPMDRGIISTIYSKLSKNIDTEEVISIYRELYRKEPFIRVLDEGFYPNAKNVRGTNLCEIGIKVVKRTNSLIVVAAIDNLVKGASGQAVQNMNLMMNFEETTSLNLQPIFP